MSSDAMLLYFFGSQSCRILLKIYFEEGVRLIIHSTMMIDLSLSH